MYMYEGYKNPEIFQPCNFLRPCSSMCPIMCGENGTCDIILQPHTEYYLYTANMCTLRLQTKIDCINHLTLLMVQCQTWS